MSSRPSLPFSQEKSKIPRDDFFSRFQSEKIAHPFDPAYLNQPNPYTGAVIGSESDYYEYLREHTYHILCDEVSVSEIVKCKNASVSRILSSNSTIKKLKRRQLLLSLVLIVSLLLLIPSSTLFRSSAALYEDGYAAGVSDQKSEDANLYEDGKADGYQKGYSEGKVKGYNEGYYKGYWEGYADAGERSTGSGNSHGESSGQHTGTGSSRDTPIADTYIGNTKTKKFHLPSCSYLPDQNHQTSFDSRDDAIAAGYTPCGHCKP